MKGKRVLSVFLSGVMVCFPILPCTGADPPLGKIVPRQAADLNGTRLALEATLYSGDTLTTQADGLALVLLPKGDQLHLGPATEVQITKAEGALLASLERGALLARSGNGQTVSVEARGLTVTPQAAARYEVVVAENRVVVGTQEGAVTVQGGDQTFTIPAGKAMRFEVTATAQGPAGTAFLSRLTPGQAFGLAAAVVGTGAFLAAWFISKSQAEDDACATVRRTVSPSSATFQCP